MCQCGLLCATRSHLCPSMSTWATLCDHELPMPLWGTKDHSVHVGLHWATTNYMWHAVLHWITMCQKESLCVTTSFYACTLCHLGPLCVIKDHSLPPKMILCHHESPLTLSATKDHSVQSDPRRHRMMLGGSEKHRWPVVAQISRMWHKAILGGSEWHRWFVVAQSGHRWHRAPWWHSNTSRVVPPRTTLCHQGLFSSTKNHAEPLRVTSDTLSHHESPWHMVQPWNTLYHYESNHLCHSEPPRITLCHLGPLRAPTNHLCHSELRWATLCHGDAQRATKRWF